MNDEENIQNENELNNEQLINYLKGKLSEEENHKIEKTMLDSDFVNDAVEGLQSFSHEKKLDDYVKQLNKNLHVHLASKKYHKRKRKIDMHWITLVTIVILAVCLIAYFIIIIEKK